MLARPERSPKEASYDGSPVASFVIQLTVWVMVAGQLERLERSRPWSNRPV